MTNADTILGTLSWIEANLRAELSVPAIAAKAGYSRYHFSRMFAAMLGMPPKEYVLRRRLSEAARQLAAGSRTVTEVAFELGFNDIDTFTRAFKREFGSSPSAVRRGAAFTYLEPSSSAVKREAACASSNFNVTVSPAFLLAGWTLPLSTAAGGMAEAWAAFSRRADDIADTERPSRLRQLAVWRDEPSCEEESGELMAGIVMRTLDRLPLDLAGRAVPACDCLTFTHRGSVDRIPDSYTAIYGELLPSMERKPAFPFNFEDYSDGLTIYIPIA